MLSKIGVIICLYNRLRYVSAPMHIAQVRGWGVGGEGMAKEEIHARVEAEGESEQWQLLA